MRGYDTSRTHLDALCFVLFDPDGFLCCGPDSMQRLNSSASLTAGQKPKSVMETTLDKSLASMKENHEFKLMLAWPSKIASMHSCRNIWPRTCSERSTPRKENMPQDAACNE